MSVYGELEPMVEHRTQFAFKGKRAYSQGQHAKYSKYKWKNRCSCLVQKIMTRLSTQIFMTRTRIFA